MFHFHKTTKPDPKENWKLVHNKKINRPFVRIKEENKYNGGYYLTHSKRGHEKLPDPIGKDKKKKAHLISKFYRNPKRDFTDKKEELTIKNKYCVERIHRKKYGNGKPVKATKTPLLLAHNVSNNKKKH